MLVAQLSAHPPKPEHLSHFGNNLNIKVITFQQHSQDRKQQE